MGLEFNTNHIESKIFKYKDMSPSRNLKVNNIKNLHYQIKQNKILNYNRK